MPVLKQINLYAPLRNTYLRLFKHDYWKRNIYGMRDGLQEFYRPFCPPGSIVFDIGANVGDYTRAFLALHATVIAAEPNPQLIEGLRKITSPRLTVVPVAIGETNSTMTLRLNSRNELSSLATDWVNFTSQENRFADGTWEGVVEVSVRPLDSLITTYGKPDFIKIDVEGFELQVLRGLTRLPRYLSFEFHGDWIKATIECLRQPCFPAGTTFNYEIEDSRKFASPRWVSAAEMITIAEIDLPKHDYGDIFARSPAP